VDDVAYLGVNRPQALSWPWRLAITMSG